MTAKLECKVDINNTLKAHFVDGLRDHYYQAIAREMIHSHPTLSYVAYKSEVLKTLGPNVKPSQFYSKSREPQLIPGMDGSLKPETDCNYCKDLGHLKYNCPKLKEKEARIAGIKTTTSLKRKTK